MMDEYKGYSIKHPSDIVALTKQYSTKRQEHFVVITLNGTHRTIRKHIATIGLANKTIVHPREIFWWAIKDNASAVVFVHNHPSGCIKPSPQDDEATEQLCKAAGILGIRVLDHLIVTKEDYYSYRQHGLISDE
jgi:DNA repair protein RadC